MNLTGSYEVCSLQSDVIHLYLGKFRQAPIGTGINMHENGRNDKGRKKFALLDYWFHFGVAINLVVVALLLWYSLFS